MFLKTLSTVTTEPARPAALPTENSEKDLTFMFLQLSELLEAQAISAASCAPPSASS
jgi:hypothetical protein